MSAHSDPIIDRLGNDDPDWLAAAYDVVKHVARHQAVVTTDDLWTRLSFPVGAAGGRVMGKVIRAALTSGLLEKARSGRFLLCLDHADLDPVRTLDGSEIRHQGPLVVYRSLLYDTASASDLGPTGPEPSFPLDLDPPGQSRLDGQAL